MTYLSSDQITGKVLVNLYSDGLSVYNNTSIKRNIEKSEIYSVTRPVTTDMIKFSKGSILDKFNVPIGEDISGDFTFSMWGYVANGYKFQFKIGSYGADSSGIGTNGYYVIGFAQNDQTSINCELGSLYGANNTTYSKTIADAWHHYALCHSNNMLYYFIDGELIRSLDISDSSYQNYITNHGLFKMYTETNWSSGGDTVYMDDIVVIKDQCVWTEKFIPPTDKLIGHDLQYTQTLYSSVNEKDRLKMY